MKKEEYIDEKLEIGSPTDVSDDANYEEAGEKTSEASIYEGESRNASDTEDISIETSSEGADVEILSNEKRSAEVHDTLPFFDGESVYTETDLFGDEHPTVEAEPADDAEADEENGDENSDNTDAENEDDEQTENSAPIPQDANAQATDAEPEEKPRRVDSLFDFIELFVFTLAAVFIITSFFFRYSIVDGGSMQNTLQDKESLILRNIFYTPESGDVIVVQDKSTVLKDPIVKRVIATEGQTVKFTRDAVYVDGVKLDEPYVYTGDYKNPFGGEDVYRYSVYPSDALLPIVTDREDGVFYEITVPDDEIFVMGDHRNNSRDSREIGTLHEDAVIGKVVLRFLPFSKFGKIE